MNKLSIYNALLLEMRRDAVIAVLGTDDGNKLLSFTQDDSYHHLVVNTAKNGEGHSVEELLDKDLLKRFKELGISTAWSTNKTLTAETAGASVTLDKQTSGYNDFVRFTEIKSSLTTKTSALIALIDKNYETGNEHFDVLKNDSEWYIVYPKTQLGSMALGRSYWDREEDKLKYDETFNDGEGDHAGEISWCTVINGPSNRFISYHMNMKLHMFYCISKRFGEKDNKRKLCLSLEKSKIETIFSKKIGACVDGDNYPKDEEFFRKTLDSSRYDELIKHTKENLEVIDSVAYYSSYNLMQYNAAFENPRIEVNIEEALNELNLILEHTKDMRIFGAMLNSDRDTEKKHQILAESEKTPLEILNKLAEIGNSKVQIAVADNPNTLVKTLDYLARTDILLVKIRVARNRNTSSETLDYLARSEDMFVQRYVADNPNTSAETLDYLARKDDVGIRAIQTALANNPNTSSETLDYLARTDVIFVQRHVADNPNTSTETLDYLARSEDVGIRAFLADNPNTPADVLKYLSKVDDKTVQSNVIRNPNCPEDIKNKLKDRGIKESYIKKYIKLLLN